MNIQAALHMLYPPRCLCCGLSVESDFGLCGPCWKDTYFIDGLVCDRCGAPLPGSSNKAVLCDECLKIARPWDHGRAALLYTANGRKMVLGLKHGDRLDIVQTAARWMVKRAHGIVKPGMLVAPVPLHWSRLLKRRFNQSAELGKHVSHELDLEWCPDLFVRKRRTPMLEGKGRDERFATLENALFVRQRHRRRIEGRSVLIIDDVLTTGATLGATTEAARLAGAVEVSVLVLARVAKEV